MSKNGPPNDMVNRNSHQNCIQFSVYQDFLSVIWKLNSIAALSILHANISGYALDHLDNFFAAFHETSSLNLSSSLQFQLKYR